MAFCHQLEYLSYSALDPNMKKSLLIFLLFFKERLLMYVLKAEGLVYIFNTLNVDIVKEVICWGGGA